MIDRHGGRAGYYSHCVRPGLPNASTQLPGRPLLGELHQRVPSPTMLKRQRPSSPSTPVGYGDDLSSSMSSSSNRHPVSNISTTTSFHADPSFWISRKRPRVSQDIVSGVGNNGGRGRLTFASSPVLSKRRRSPDPMDESADSGDESQSRPGHQFSNIHPEYQRQGDPLPPRQAVNLKRRRTAAPVLDGSSRGWGPDQPSHSGSGPGIPCLTPYPHDPSNPPQGWVLETESGEYAQENARLYDLHTLRPRLPPPEHATQDPNAVLSVDVNMEEKVVKERYEEHNKCVHFCSFRICPWSSNYHTRLLGSLFLERQRRLAGT